MPSAYHVDRSGNCSAGRVFELDANGLSEHGRGYLRPIARRDENNDESMFESALIETIFEYVRQLEFPDMPSRYTCMFGFDPDEPEDQWAHQESFRGFPVWEVTAWKSHKLDAALLSIYSYDERNNLYFNAPLAYKRAQSYWRGESIIDFLLRQHGPDFAIPKNTHPRWELLLVHPVKVLRRVQLPD